MQVCGPSEQNGVKSFWQAVERLLSSALTDAFAFGVTGSSARRFDAGLLHSDLVYWLFPGLAVCGIEAGLIPLPDAPEACRTLLRQQSRRSGGVCLFAFSSDIEAEKTTFSDLHERPAAPDIQEIDPAVTATALVTAISPQTAQSETVTISEPGGAATALDAAVLRSRFSHALTLRKGARRPVKAEVFAYAVRAWAQFACACPARVIGTNPSDAPLRAQAAAFWRQMAGTGRSAQAARVRRLADLLATPKDKNDLAAAFRALYEMACESLLLPPFIENALLAPSASALSDAERRELIYLARAGTHDVKIFAAHRLTFERECADARATLQQLRHDADAWVRGAAQ